MNPQSRLWSSTDLGICRLLFDRNVTGNDSDSDVIVGEFVAVDGSHESVVESDGGLRQRAIDPSSLMATSLPPPMFAISPKS